MPILIENFVKDCISGIWEIKETEAELLQLISLSENDQKKLFSTRADKRRIEIIATRVLMKKIGIEEDIFYIGDTPFCKNGYISISHSKSLVTVIWNKNNKVAIDIEEIKDKLQYLSYKVFSDEEIAFCNNDNKKLTILWNCKEAVYKIFGDKDLIFKTEIYVCPFSLNDSEITTIVKKDKIEKKYYLQFMEIKENTLCWCVDRK